MAKEKYLEKLSKMDGEKLVEELLYRDYLLTQEEKSSDEYTERYFKLKYMYNICKDYIVDKLISNIILSESKKSTKRCF